MPTLTEQQSDPKKQLDAELKRVCEEMIVDVARLTSEPLSSFRMKVEAFKLRKTDGQKMQDQPFATMSIP
jgi:hypothetical protein